MMVIRRDPGCSVTDNNDGGCWTQVGEKAYEETVRLIQKLLTE